MTPISLLRLAVYGVFVTLASGCAANELTFQSRVGRHTSLLELYTSEGCSSCPPAEAWLSRLADSPQLWTEIVPVAFHVDYWGNLGWRDRFASPSATERQRIYAARWGNASVYTPGVVLDGREWREWSGFAPGALPDLVRGTAGAGQLRVTVADARTVSVAYRPGAGSGTLHEVTIALLGCDLHSSVTAGENRGRSLRHDFVALTAETKKLVPGKSEESAAFTLPAASLGARRLALAVWVDNSAGGDVQQAAGGWLTAP